MTPYVAVAFLVVSSLVLILSVCSVIWPRRMWQFREGWKYKDLEPSKAALFLLRVRGVFGALLCAGFIAIAVWVLLRSPLSF